MPVKSASLTIGSIDLTKEVTADMTSAKFEVDLKAGTTCIETSLNLGDEGKTLATDCVYVEYIGVADAAQAGKYLPSVPEQVYGEK